MLGLAESEKCRILLKKGLSHYNQNVTTLRAFSSEAWLLTVTGIKGSEQEVFWRGYRLYFHTMYAAWQGFLPVQWHVHQAHTYTGLFYFVELRWTCLCCKWGERCIKEDVSNDQTVQWTSVSKITEICPPTQNRPKAYRSRSAQIQTILVVFKH